MITLTGLDCITFAFILQDFEYYFDNYSPYSMDGAIVHVEKVGRRKGRPVTLCRKYASSQQGFSYESFSLSLDYQDSHVSQHDSHLSQLTFS